MTKKVMTKEEFKRRWESDDDGGGITYDDVADCAKAWGISKKPRTQHQGRLAAKVLIECGINDWEENK